MWKLKRKIARIELAGIVEPEDSVVDIAVELADSVLAELRRVPRVAVSLRGVAGLTSAFFNQLFVLLMKSHPLEDVERHVLFEFDSASQEALMRRSLEALRTEAGLN